MFVAIPHETVYLAKIVFIRSYCDFFYQLSDNADKMITRMKLFGSDAKALYDLDQENAARVYSVPSPLAAAE